MGEYISVEAAATATGISARTIRYWIVHGKLPATAEQGRKLVRLDDVRQIAIVSGRVRGNGDGHPSLGSLSTNGSAAGSPTGVAMGSELFARIRDEWVQPLVVQIAYQAECIGQLGERAALAEAHAGEERARRCELERLLEMERERREQAERACDRAWRQMKDLALARLRDRARQGNPEAGDTAGDPGCDPAVQMHPP